LADKKLRFAILSQFKKRLIAKGIAPNINDFKEQWAADALIESYGYDNCLDALDYYIRINDAPNWSWFSYNIDKVVAAMEARDEDDRIRQLLRKRAKEWVNS